MRAHRAARWRARPLICARRRRADAQAHGRRIRGALARGTRTRCRASNGWADRVVAHRTVAQASSGSLSRGRGHHERRQSLSRWPRTAGSGRAEVSAARARRADPQGVPRRHRDGRAGDRRQARCDRARARCDGGGRARVARRRAGRRQDAALQVDRRRDRYAVRAHPVHAGLAADGHHGCECLRRSRSAGSLPPGPDLHAHPARRRDQPRDASRRCSR